MKFRIKTNMLTDFKTFQYHFLNFLILQNTTFIILVEIKYTEQLSKLLCSVVAQQYLQKRR